MSRTLTPILTTASERRDTIREKAVKAIESVFPMIGKKYDLHVEDVKLDPKTYSSQEQKQAILSGSSLTEPIKATLVIKDKAGNVIDKSRSTTVLHLPWLDPRSTFITDGNSYSINNQLRLRPGVYVRKRGNEELEAGFNAVKKGGNFGVTLDPESGVFSLKKGTSHIPLHPILRALGVPNSELSKAWGPELALSNATKIKDPSKAINSLYEKITPEWKLSSETTPEAKVSAIRDWFASAKLDPEVVEKTLGLKHDSVKPETLLKASAKLLNVFKKAEDVDDRDSLEFKRLISADDFIKERIQLAGRDLKKKIMWKLDRSHGPIEMSKVVPPSMFSKSIKAFLTTSDVSALPTQYNPAEIIDSSLKVTPLGTGGIQSDRAIEYSTRTVHPSHMGILDPIKTPESGNVGAELRATIHAAKDEDGALYAPLKNMKTGKFEYVSAGDIASKIIAFPRQEVKKGKMCEALKAGVLTKVDGGQVDYQLVHAESMYSPATNMVGFLENSQANRNVMASKMQTQAMSLEDNEEPLVQVASYRPGETMEHQVGQMTLPVSPIAGVVDHVDKDYIYIRKHDKIAAPKSSDELIRVSYDTNLPLATKTYLHNDVTVKAGDKVTEGQALATSNWTKNGAMALGKNLNVALMPYRGTNSNDAIVISSGAAKKLTSLHMYKEMMDLEPDMVLGKDKHQSYFGNKYSAAQYAKLDDKGVTKKGATLDPGDPIFLCIVPRTMGPDDAILGRLHSSLVKPYADHSHTWEHGFEGEVVDVVEGPKMWAITVKTKEPMQVGDKLTGLFGNKGVIAEIVPDEKMIQDESGKPIDVLLTSLGVVSRVNPGQILHMAVAKVAKKLGHPITIQNFSGKDNVQYAKKLLKENGLTDKETVFDPVTGKKIPGVMVGPQYMLKLMKSTSTNYSARGVESYDVNQQPSKGGSSGAKGVGRQEVAGFIAHGARNFLKDTALIKSQKNDEFWKSVQLGLPPPAPKTTFAYNKFGNMLAGSGIKFDKVGNKLTLGPLTDEHIKEMSSGAIVEPKFVRAKDLKAEPGGLFDPGVTGGTEGTKWSHIDLHEPIVNPMFNDPVRHLLGMTQKELRTAIEDKGAGWVKDQLAKIDLSSKKKELLASTKKLRGANLDKAVKQLKYIDALQKKDLRPEDAYVLTKIPVVPPNVRMITLGSDGLTQINDANYLYRDLMLANSQLDAAKKELTPEYVAKARGHLHDAVGAVFGLNDPVSDQNVGRGVKGFLSALAGSNPKHGFIQSKLVKHQQDLSARGTVAPDVNMAMDEIGLPETMLWTLFGHFVVGRLVRRGYDAIKARELVEQKAPAAREELLREAKERPVVYNRAPSLHRYNLLASYPVPVPGQTIRIPATWSEKAQALDFDGDNLQIHTPVSKEAVEDAKRMTLPHLLFGDRQKDILMVKPEMEAVTGAYIASGLKSSENKVKIFKNADAVMAAYKRNEIELNDPVEIE